MKVRDLIKTLSAIDQDLDVVIQENLDFSIYSLLSGVDKNCMYVPESHNYVIVYDQNELDNTINAKKCCVLYSKTNCE